MSSTGAARWWAANDGVRAAATAIAMAIVNQLVTILAAYGRRYKRAMAETWKKYSAQGLSDGLAGRVPALTEAVAKAKAVVEQRRQVIEAARKQIYGLAVEIVALSDRLAEESTANDKLLKRAEEVLEEAKFNARWQRESIVRWTRRT